jgi:putative SOS response-associated peptidase YedK
VWPRPPLLDVSQIKLVFSIPPHRPTPQLRAELECGADRPAPGGPLRCKAGEQSLDVMRWGLVLFCAKDIKVGFSNINAKAEGIEKKPAFREAFQRRVAFLPVDNFYE